MCKSAKIKVPEAPMIPEPPENPDELKQDAPVTASEKKKRRATGTAAFRRDLTIPTGGGGSGYGGLNIPV